MVSAPASEQITPINDEEAASKTRAHAHHSLARHGVWVFVGRLSNVAIAALSTFVVARLLPQEEFGRFSSILAATQLISLAGIFGLDQAVLREVGKTFAQEDRRQFRPLLRTFAHLAIWTLLACALLGTLFLVLAGPTLVKETIPLYALIGTVLFTVVRAAIQMAGETARALDDPLAANLLGGTAGGALGTAGFLLLLWIANANATVDWGTAMGLYFAASSVPLFLILYRVQRAIKPFPKSDPADAPPVAMGDLVKQTALPLFLISIVAFGTSRADVLLLSFFRPPDEVAVYEAARRLTLLLSIPLGLMNMMVVSSISRLYYTGKFATLQTTFRTASALASIPCLIACMFFLFYPRATLAIAFGPDYAAAATILQLLVPGQLAIVLTGTCGIALIHTGHSRLSFLVSMVAPLTLLCLGPYTATHYGTTGIATLTSFSLVLQNASNWAVLFYKTSIWTHPSYWMLFTLCRNQAAKYLAAHKNK